MHEGKRMVVVGSYLTRIGEELLTNSGHVKRVPEKIKVETYLQS